MLVIVMTLPKKGKGEKKEKQIGLVFEHFHQIDLLTNQKTQTKTNKETNTWETSVNLLRR